MTDWRDIVIAIQDMAALFRTRLAQVEMAHMAEDEAAAAARSEVDSGGDTTMGDSSEPRNIDHPFMPPVQRSPGGTAIPAGALHNVRLAENVARLDTMSWEHHPTHGSQAQGSQFTSADGKRHSEINDMIADAWGETAKSVFFAAPNPPGAQGPPAREPPRRKRHDFHSAERLVDLTNHWDDQDDLEAEAPSRADKGGQNGAGTGAAPSMPTEAGETHGSRPSGVLADLPKQWNGPEGVTHVPPFNKFHPGWCDVEYDNDVRPTTALPVSNPPPRLPGPIGDNDAHLPPNTTTGFAILRPIWGETTYEDHSRLPGTHSYASKADKTSKEANNAEAGPSNSNPDAVASLEIPPEFNLFKPGWGEATTRAQDAPTPAVTHGLPRRERDRHDLNLGPSSRHISMEPTKASSVTEHWKSMSGGMYWEQRWWFG